MLYDTFIFRRSVLALAISLACASGTTSAAEINVRSDCTLVNAINNANADADTDGPKGCPAGSGADIINLGHHKRYLVEAPNWYYQPNGLPSISSTISISGNGSVVSGKGRVVRIFHVGSKGRLTLDSITISNGRLFTSYRNPASGRNGAGLRNEGVTILQNSVVTSNSASAGSGGGITNIGTMTLINSTVSKNSTGVYYTAGRWGGGAGIYNTGKLTVNNSTISNNSATGSDYSEYYGAIGGHGGGMKNSGKATINNSTLSGNHAYFAGGGIRNTGTLTLKNVTLSGNASYYGGGINNLSVMTLKNSTLSGNKGGGLYNKGTLILVNNIIANSVGVYTSDCSNNAILQSSRDNLIEDGSCGAKLSGDPKLGPLKDNGGPTRTHALLRNSPAIDAGVCTSHYDQRGVKRPQTDGALCDIGAFERIPIRSDRVSPTVWPIVDFFKVQSASGGIIGTGVLTRQNRFAALNQLAAAGDYRENLLDNEACGQLNRLLLRIDTDSSPDNNDHVTGSEAGALADQITELKGTWGCP